MDNNNQIKFSTVIYSLLIFVVIFIILSSTIIFVFKPENSLLSMTARVIPIPAAVIGFTNFIAIGDLDDQLASVRKFYEDQDFADIGMRVDFSTSDGKKRLKIKEKEILNKLIENKIIESGAKKQGIILTDKMVTDEVERTAKEYGGNDSLDENLKKLYGWNVDDFEENIVKPDLYKERLIKHLEKNDPDINISKTRIEDARKDLERGDDFSEVARKYSDGESKDDGGKMGWFRVDQMVSEIAGVVPDLAKNRTSEIVRSPLGFHIVVVTDKKVENDVDMYEIKQIFVRTKTLADWLDNEEMNTSIMIPLRDYYWDEKTRSVEFSDSRMRDFENKQSSEVN